MSKMLAIVISAYKHQFLRETLNSIANQSCKDFNLYIGDDDSPNPIGEIIEEFRDKLDLVCKRFDENLGGKSLVAHWKRCIEMTLSEEWLIILGDDDLISENHVEDKKITLVFIQPGKPMKNAYIERLNGSLRCELLNAYVLKTVSEVREQVSDWIEDFNFHRPHDFLSNKTPVEWSANVFEKL